MIQLPGLPLRRLEPDVAPYAVIDGGSPRRWQLAAIKRLRLNVHVLQLPSGVDGLDFLRPLGPQGVQRLVVSDYACEDVSALSELSGLRSLTLQTAPRRGLQALAGLSALQEYGGAWFEGLDPLLASPVLRVLYLDGPPADLARRLTAPLRRLRLDGAKKLSAVPALSNASELERLDIAGGGALDVAPVQAYTGLTELAVYGRTPLVGLDALTLLPVLRRLQLEECYAFDVEALAGLGLRWLSVVGRPASFEPNVLTRLSQLSVPDLHLPQPLIS